MNRRNIYQVSVTLLLLALDGNKQLYPVPLLPPYPPDGWILRPCKQIITDYFLFFNDVPFRLQARICIISKRAAYGWGLRLPGVHRKI